VVPAAVAPAGVARPTRQLIFGENLPTFAANFLYRVIADPNSGYRYRASREALEPVPDS
jgi:hypothetical protein